MSGKALRLKRIVSGADGRTVILPLDHGVSRGPLPGLERVADAARAGINGGADAIVLHKGMLRCLDSAAAPLPGIIMHLSASTALGPSPYRKVLAGDVEEAIRRGADAVSVHLNLGNEFEHEMLRDLGLVGRSCLQWQIPLLVMAYACWNAGPASGPQIAHAARVAAELGADVIKLPFPGDYDVLAGIASNIPVPVVIAGGVSGPVGQLFERIEKSLQAGARGIAAGRGVFQHKNPEAVLGAIRGIVHRGIGAEEAAASLGDPATQG